MRKAVLFYLFILICYFAKSQSSKLYTVANGLSCSQITNITQDFEGYLWIATEDGLNKFDGSNFTVYRNIPNDKNSIPHNQIRCVLEDSQKRLWVATLGGLCIYDRQLNRFHRYNIDFSNKKEEDIQCYYILEDKNKYLWVSISGHGVVRFKPGNHNAQYFNTTNSGICSNHINVIYEDAFGNIWLCSGKEGISVYNEENGVFRTFKAGLSDSSGLQSNNVTSIGEDKDNNVWVATLAEGISVYSPSKHSFAQFEYFKDRNSYLYVNRNKEIWLSASGYGVETIASDKSIKQPLRNISSVNLPQSKVDVFYEDRLGNMWMGIYYKGLLVYSPRKRVSNIYSSNIYDPQNSIPEGSVSPLIVDSKNNLWLAVDGKGLYILDANKQVKKEYLKVGNAFVSSIIPLSMFEDSQENMWIGTYLGGLVHYNRAQDKFDFILKAGEKSLSSPDVRDIKEDKNGLLWIATNGGGINIYNPKDKTFSYLRKNDLDKNPNQLIDNWCNKILIDKNDLYWFATYRGLSLYDAQKKKFTNFTVMNKMIPNNAVLTLYKDKRENMWVGTLNGLACIAKDRKHVRFFNITDGLPNATIANITEDDNGNIWLISSRGIATFDFKTNTIKPYIISDGLSSSEFMINSLSKTEQGEFLIGSTNGFVGFYPSLINSIREKPAKLILSNLYLFNKQIHPNDSDNDILSKSLDYQSKISLSYRQNSFSIEVSAIEYQYPEKIHYTACLEGFDKQYYPVNNHIITYTNLQPGKYILHVRAWINSEKESITRQLVIYINPPFWASTWAKILYLILILLIAYSIYSQIKRRAIERHNQQMMQAKFQFFTDISHEIRTPLTLILSPLSKLIGSNPDPKLLHTYNLMYKNGTRLLQMVNQVMDLRSVEFGKKKLAIEEIDITQFASELKNAFCNLAEEKDINFLFTAHPDRIVGYIDTDILSKVLYNLISNAFKYTEKGSIHLRLEENEQILTISLSDTGIGIPEKQLPFIFDRFVMLNATSKNRSISSGIGLHLISKLVKLHHGEIGVQSQEGEGSTFIIKIPINKESYSQDEFLPGKSRINTSVSPVVSEIESDEQSHSKSTFNHSILVVDDNEDMRQMIAEEFQSNYIIYEASNGKEALRLAIEKEPTIIISDVVMPEMDGIELCRMVRKNKNICHVSIILLTVQSSIKQQINGIDQGADAYIPKPFDLLYLRTTVERLIQSREDLRKKYLLKTTESILTENLVETKEDVLIKKLNEFINEQIDNPNLNVDILCEKLGTSRTSLNRKMKELTGETPAMYIRRIRLQKAAILLKMKNLTVSEIAYGVGFSSPSYFCQAFRDYYGIPPKDYMNTND